MKNNSSIKTQKGSALIVTIMITSVSIMFAILLLERVIPYARQIRGMEDSLQAYYQAKGEIELAKNDFFKKQIRGNIRDVDRVLASAVIWEINLKYPTLDESKRGDFVVISNNSKLPLKIRLFEKDAQIQSFGTSQKDPDYHAFPTYGGWLFFDISNFGSTQWGTTPFSMAVNTEDTTILAGIKVEFVHTSGSITPFFGTVEEDPLWPLDGKNIKNAIDKNRIAPSDVLSHTTNLLGECKTASCALKLELISASPSIVPVSFSLSAPIPDLNAVVVADGLSKKANYHTRIIELIPLIQSI